jgi:sialic acid synthase SpsE
MHCVSSYPLDPEKSDLLCIKSLMNNFNCLIGYSDHTQGIEIPLYAVAIGAQVIEKHFKIDNKMNCVDKNVSITENEMKKMVNKIRLLENSLGTGKLHLRKNEKDIIQYRRISN